MSFWKKLLDIDPLTRKMRSQWEGDTFGEKLTNAVALDPLSKRLQRATPDWVKDPAAGVYDWLGGPEAAMPNPPAAQMASYKSTPGAKFEGVPDFVKQAQSLARSKALRGQQIQPQQQSPFMRPAGY